MNKKQEKKAAPKGLSQKWLKLFRNSAVGVETHLCILSFAPQSFSWPQSIEQGDAKMRLYTRRTSFPSISKQLH